MHYKKKTIYILWVNLSHFWIYIGILVLGIFLVGLSFKNAESNWFVLSGSLGTSLLGAVVLAWLIDAANNIMIKKKLKYIRNREIGIIFWGVKKLFCLLYKEYLLINKREIEEGTEIKVYEAIDEMYNFFNTNNRIIDTTNDIHIEMINWKKCLAETINKTILEDSRYFLNNDIFTDEELNGLKELYGYLLDSDNDLCSFDDYKLIVNDTYSEFAKINNYFFKINKYNRVAIYSQDELNKLKKI